MRGTSSQSKSTTQDASTSSYDNDKKKPLKYALPPWHSVLTVVVLASGFAKYSLPTLAQLDEDAKVERFTNILFPRLFPSLWYLFYFRVCVACTIWATSYYLVFVYPGWSQTPSYPKSSKLIVREIHLRGIKTMFPFTSVSWNLLGLSFSLNAYITLLVIRGESNEIPQLLLRFSLLIWECAAPFTFLVASVIRFAIWPKVLAVGGDTGNLKHWRNVLMHNINVWFALAETALVSGLSTRPSHIGIAPLFGFGYVLFSWAVANSWVDHSKYGPQYIYFFLDTTLPGGKPTYALLALLATLMAFYGLFSTADIVFQHLGGNLLAHLLGAALLGSSVCRFRD